MANRVILEDHAPELDGVVGSALYPGGVDQPGRIEGEQTLRNLYGPVVGWFTVREATSTGSHPDFAKEAWGDVPLPVRENHYNPDFDTVSVLVIDAFNGLADNKVDEEALYYWGGVFSSLGTRFLPDDMPVVSFVKEDGVLEPNTLLQD